MNRWQQNAPALQFYHPTPAPPHDQHPTEPPQPHQSLPYHYHQQQPHQQEQHAPDLSAALSGLSLSSPFSPQLQQTHPASRLFHPDNTHNHNYAPQQYNPYHFNYLSNNPNPNPKASNSNDGDDDHTASNTKNPNHSSPNHQQHQKKHLIAPDDHNACLTDSEIAARALAASGLNVAAPEFVPSFALPSSSPSHTPPYPASPEDALYPHPVAGVNAAINPNVLDFNAALSQSPADSSSLTSDQHHPSSITNLAAHYPGAAPSDYAYDPIDYNYDYNYNNINHAADNNGTINNHLHLSAHSHPDVNLHPHLTSAPFPPHPYHHNYYYDDDDDDGDNDVRAEADENADEYEEAAPSPEAAVSHFEAHFPALCSSSSSATKVASARARNERIDAQRALGWRALQHEQAAKAREAEASRRLDAFRAGLSEAADLDAVVAPDEFGPDDALYSGDAGAVWVSTGRSVGALYESLRAEAAEQARIRNRYFDRATTAFKKGDGATARKLGALGREANNRMKELHGKAADAIFEVRNPPGVDDVVDLHGLHVAEALDRLPDALHKAAAGKVRILTGSGHHTKGTGRARLRPAVKKWLQDRGYFFEEVIDMNEHVGSFIVEKQ